MKFLLKNILKLENCNSFQGFEEHHLPSAYLKSTLEESWQESSEILHYTCGNKFRTPLDVNQYIFRYKQLAEGKFHPVSRSSRGKCCQIWMDTSEMYNVILNEEYKMICLNDTTKDIDFDAVMEIIKSAYDKKFPQCSLFERS